MTLMSQHSAASDMFTACTAKHSNVLFVLWFKQCWMWECAQDDENDSEGSEDHDEDDEDDDQDDGDDDMSEPFSDSEGSSEDEDVEVILVRKLGPRATLGSLVCMKHLHQRGAVT